MNRKVLIILSSLFLSLFAFTLVICLTPSYYYNRGVFYSRQEKWELALADYNQVIAFNPHYAPAYSSRGNVYYNQKKWELALTDYNKAIAINPDYAQFYSNRGVVYHVQGNYTAAMSDYNQALAKDANCFGALANIGFIKYEQGDIDTAIKQWQQAMKINNQSAQSAEPMLALAVALYAKGEEQQAYQLAETALKLDKNLAATNILNEKSWGGKIIIDAQKFLSTPKIKTLLLQLH